MNKLFFSIFLISTVYYANCVEYNVVLNNLCQKHHFFYYETYESEIKLVNSFLRISSTKKMNLKNEITTNDLSYPESWDRAEKDQIYEVKSGYQKLVNEVLDERYINSLREMDNKRFWAKNGKQRETQIELAKKLNNVSLSIKKKDASEENLKILQVYKDRLENLHDFIYFTGQIKIDQLYERILTPNELQSILNDLNKRLGDSLSFIINLKNSERYYYELLFKLIRFKLGDGDSLSTMQYELFIPIHNEKFIEKGCADKRDLTTFFKSAT